MFSFWSCVCKNIWKIQRDIPLKSFWKPWYYSHSSKKGGFTNKRRFCQIGLGHLMWLEGLILFSIFAENSLWQTIFRVSKNFLKGISSSIYWLSLQQQPQSKNKKFQKLYLDFTYCKLPELAWCFTPLICFSFFFIHFLLSIFKKSSAIELVVWVFGIFARSNKWMSESRLLQLIFEVRFHF